MAIPSKGSDATKLATAELFVYTSVYNAVHGLMLGICKVLAKQRSIQRCHLNTLSKAF